MEEMDYLEEVLGETKRLLSDLFTSGLVSAHDGTLEEMDKISDTCRQCGLTFAGEKLKELAEEVKANRHRMSGDFDRAVDLFCSLDQYLSLCERKLTLDKVRTWQII